MARGVEESHHAAWSLDVIGTDVLGDATGLASRHLGAANVVEQRSLAVIDMSHDRDYRWPWQILEAAVTLANALDVFFDLVFLDQPGLMPHFLDHQHRRVLVQ